LGPLGRKLRVLLALHYAQRPTKWSRPTRQLHRSDPRRRCEGSKARPRPQEPLVFLQVLPPKAPSKCWCSPDRRWSLSLTLVLSQDNSPATSTLHQLHVALLCSGDRDLSAHRLRRRYRSP